MRLSLILVVSLTIGFFAPSDACAKKAPPKLPAISSSRFPNRLLSMTRKGSLYQAAAADTYVLGWWQFDTPSGQPTTQGWTAYDLTTQIRKYWHVDGNTGSPCTGITPINGTKSMWCGQWATMDYPWCGWAALPGYGINWDQSLESSVAGTSITYTIAWDSEPGYDFTHIEWWDTANSLWVADPNANAGAGSFDGAGGPLTETLTSPYGATRARFRVTSDGAWCDQDGLWDTDDGAARLDNLRIDAGPVEDWKARRVSRSSRPMERG